MVLKQKNSILFLFLAGVGMTQLHSEILNYRKIKVQEEKPITPNTSDREIIKAYPFISEVKQYTTDSIPKPNTPPIPEKEKIIVPLTPPNNPLSLPARSTKS